MWQESGIPGTAHYIDQKNDYEPPIDPMYYYSEKGEKIVDQDNVDEISEKSDE